MDFHGSPCLSTWFIKRKVVGIHSAVSWILATEFLLWNLFQRRNKGRIHQDWDSPHWLRLGDSLCPTASGRHRVSAVLYRRDVASPTWSAWAEHFTRQDFPSFSWVIVSEVSGFSWLLCCLSAVLRQGIKVEQTCSHREGRSGDEKKGGKKQVGGD